MSLNSKIFSEEKNDNNNNNLESDSLESHQLLIEHMTGFYDLMQYVSKSIQNGSKIKINNNIIYLDNISSKDFYMGPRFSEKYNIYSDNGEKKEVEIKNNPFITSKYNFINIINWEAAYIYGNYLYLVAEEKHTNSKRYKNYNSFTLAIYCDMENKFDIFKNETEIDIRQLLMQFTVENEEKKIYRTKTFVETRVIEKRIKFMILDSSNLNTLYRYSDKYFKDEHEKYKKTALTGTDELFGNFYNQHASDFEKYKVTTDNYLKAYDREAKKDD